MPRTSLDKGWLSRERALAIALLVITGIAFYLCYLLALPFAAPFAWGLALAVIAHPLHHWLAEKIPWRSVSAAVSVAIVAVLLLLPAAFVVHQIVTQAAALAQGEKKPAGTDEQSGDESPGQSDENAQADRDRSSGDSDDERAQQRSRENEEGRNNEEQAGDREDHEAEEEQSFFARLENDPRLGRLRGWIKAQNLQSQVNEALQRAATLAPQYVAGGVWIGAQFLITLLVLFYFFRDRKQVVEGVRGLLPLSDSETDDAFQRIEDTIYATIFGSLTVALVQGVMGGLMFWFLGLPAPFIWGAVMALLATIPMLGTFVIWLPAAIFLAVSGEWGKAAILVAWGGIAIALLDNLLYPLLVGKRLQFHPLLVFVSIVGGIYLFGAAGIILGPLVLSVTDALIHVWRSRTEDGGKVEEGVRE